MTEKQLTDDQVRFHLRLARQQRAGAVREGGRASEFLIDMCDDAIRKLESIARDRGLEVQESDAN